MWAWMPVVLYVAVIVGASSVPARYMPSAEFLWSLDKVVHAAEYFALGALLARALSVGSLRLRGARAFATAALAGALLGGADELYQTTTPGRTGTVYDAYADALGAALGALVMVLWVANRSNHVDHSQLRR